MHLGQGKYKWIANLVFTAWAAVLVAWWAYPRGPRWEQPRRVAIVVQSVETFTDAVSEQRLDALVRRLPALEDQLNFEYSRYREGAGPAFRFTTFGPVVGGVSPPPLPLRGVKTKAGEYRQESEAYAAKLAERVKLETSDFDSIVYVVATDWALLAPGDPPHKRAQKFSIARVHLEDDSPDRVLFAVARELMYTLGADDEVDLNGNPRIPSGLGDPEQNPLYPQVYANVMAGQVVVYPGELALPKALRQLSIAPDTARDIGWIERRR